MAAARPSSAYASAEEFPLAPSDLERLSAQRVAARARGLVAERPREAREQSGPELDVLLGERRESLLEQRHEPIIAPGSDVHVLACVAPRRAGELAAQADAARDPGGIEEGLLGCRSVPRAYLRFSERDQELAARPLV